MTDQLDAVARALANAIWGGTAEEDAFDLLSPGEQDTYRGWAQAAIDALGLTERPKVCRAEYGDRCTCGSGA